MYLCLLGIKNEGKYRKIRLTDNTDWQCFILCVLAILPTCKYNQMVPHLTPLPQSLFPVPDAPNLYLPPTSHKFPHPPRLSTVCTSPCSSVGDVWNLWRRTRCWWLAVGEKRAKKVKKRRRKPVANGCNAHGDGHPFSQHVIRRTTTMTQNVYMMKSSAKIVDDLETSKRHDLQTDLEFQGHF